MTRTLLQQAFDALHPQANRAFVEATKDALRSALAAPQPEPWMHDCAALCTNDVELWIDACPHCGKPRTAPPAAPADMVMVPKEPTHEMLYAMAELDGWRKGDRDHPMFTRWRDYWYVALAAAPAPAVPLTEEQFADIVAEASLAVDLAANPLKLLAFARAVLSAAPAAPRPDEFTCPYCFDQGAAPAVPVAWEYQNQHGNRFLTHRDPAKWHENDRAGFNNFRALGYVAPAVREPQDERIRWRDAVIKEAESALRTAEQEFADMPTWANVGHAAKKVTHALAVIAALGIGGGGNG